MIDKITAPLAYIMRWLYGLVDNYAVALFLFAIIAAIITLPLTVLKRRNDIIKAKMGPELSKAAKKYAKPKDAPIASEDKTLEERRDILKAEKKRQENYKLAIAEIYEKYKYNPLGNSIVWIIRLPIILAVFRVVTMPLAHLCVLPSDVITAIMTKASEYTTIAGMSQLQGFEIMRQYFTEFLSSIPNLSAYYPSVESLPNLTILNGMIDMSQYPSLKNPNLSLIFPAAIFIMTILQSVILNAVKAFKNRNEKRSKLTFNVVIAKIISVLSSSAFMIYIAFRVPPMLCVYYIASGVVGLVVNVILSLVMPMPKIPPAEDGEDNESTAPTDENETIFDKNSHENVDAETI